MDGWMNETTIDLVGGLNDLPNESMIAVMI